MKLWPYLVGILLSLSGCAELWNSANERGLAQDVIRMMSAAGGHVLTPECRMIGTTRSGLCLFQASQAQVQSIAISLNLADAATLPPDDPRRSALSFWEHEGCRQQANFASAVEVQVYLSEQRPTQSAMAGFEYVLLYHRPDLNAACVQLSYGYG